MRELTGKLRAGPGRCLAVIAGLARRAILVLFALGAFHAPAWAADGEAYLVIYTDESEDSGALLAARTMALRMEVITNAPVQFIIDDQSDENLLDSYARLSLGTNSIFMMSIRHIIEFARPDSPYDPENYLPLARGINIPQTIVSDCGRYADATEIVSDVNDTTVRIGVLAGSELDLITARSFWRHATMSEPDIVTVRNLDALTGMLAADGVDLAVLSYTTAIDQFNKGMLCPRLLLSDEPFEHMPDLVTAKHIGIPISVHRVWGYVINADVEREAAEQLETILVESMNNVTYRDLLEFAGLDRRSVAGSDDWANQLANLVYAFETGMVPLGDAFPQQFSSLE